jgi:RNA polymerase sigma-B factor
MATLSMQKILTPGNQRERDAGISPVTPTGKPTASTGKPVTEQEDGELLRLVRSLPKTSPLRVKACEELVSRHRKLVLSCAQRYAGGPEPTEDLIQVGYVGLLKAVNRFDPAVGGSLAAYAQPCITGEIKRHFRDKRWQVHVKRPLKELALQIRDAIGPLTQQLGHEPSDRDLADALNATEKQIRQGRVATLVLQTWSLDAPLTTRPGAANLGEVLGHNDPNIEKLLNLRAVAAHWGELPRREQRILVMRFYGEMTQAQIGAQFGISQMQVSRLLAHALGYLRERILDLADSHSSHLAAS